jgi:hypothetical protein
MYELLGIRNSKDPELGPPKDAEKLCDMTRVASDYFERTQLNKAAQCYREILMAFPGDPVAKSLLAICRRTVNSRAEYE